MKYIWIKKNWKKHTIIMIILWIRSLSGETWHECVFMLCESLTCKCDAVSTFSVYLLGTLAKFYVFIRQRQPNF